MSLIENTANVQKGIALLDQANPRTYVRQAYDKFPNILGLGAAAVTFVFGGFIEMFVSYFRNSTMSYDALCASFAKKHIAIQRDAAKNNNVVDPSLVKAQREVVAELRGRVQNLTVSKKDAANVMQAAQYKLEQAVCAAYGMPTDGTADDEQVIAQAKEASAKLVQDLGRREVRAAALELSGKPVDGAEKAIEERAKSLADKGLFSSTEEAREEIEASFGEKLRQGFVGTAGERNFVKKVKDLSPAQVRTTVKAEEKRCLETLKKLVKERQEAIQARYKAEKASEAQAERVGDLQEEVTNLQGDLEAAEAELRRAERPETGDVDQEEVERLAGEVEQLTADLDKAEAAVRNAGNAKVRRTLEAATRAVRKVEASYFEHLQKFFQVEVVRSRLVSKKDETEADLLDAETVAALAAAGTIDEDDDGKLTFVKLPKEKALKAALDTEALQAKVESDARKDRELVAGLREGAVARAATSTRKAPELSMQEQIARGIVDGLAAAGIGRPADEEYDSQNGDDRRSDAGEAGVDGEAGVRFAQHEELPLDAAALPRQASRGEDTVLPRVTRVSSQRGAALDAGVQLFDEAQPRTAAAAPRSRQPLDVQAGFDPRVAQMRAALLRAQHGAGNFAPEAAVDGATA